MSFSVKWYISYKTTSHFCSICTIPLSAFLSVLAKGVINNKRDQTSQISLDILDKPQLISKVRGRDRE